MESVIITYLLENWPILAFLVIIVIGIGKLVRMATRWEDQNEQRHNESKVKHKETESRLKELEQQNRREEQRILDSEHRHKDSETRLSNIEKALKDVSFRIATIERYLIKNGGAGYNEFTQMNSPRQLNPKGRRLFTLSGAEAFLQDNKDELLKMLSAEMDGLKVKTALDVEMLAQRVCMEISQNEGFKPIKDFIYLHPVFEDSNISIDTITMLMGLELRNEYLKIHPEIQPEEKE